MPLNSDASGFCGPPSRPNPLASICGSVTPLVPLRLAEETSVGGVAAGKPEVCIGSIGVFANACSHAGMPLLKLELAGSYWN